MKAPLVVFLSGSGRTLMNLADRIDSGDVPAKIAQVVASRPCLGADRARQRGLPVQIIQEDLPATDVERVLNESGARLGVLAGYLKKLAIPKTYINRIVNIHPALLPSFGGPGMFGDHVHQAVLDAGCKVSGCTVHLCDDRYDHGPIIAQRCCDVRDDDTASSLAARVFQLELELYPQTIAELIAGQIRVQDRRGGTAL